MMYHMIQRSIADMSTAPDRRPQGSIQFYWAKSSFAMKSFSRTIFLNTKSIFCDVRLTQLINKPNLIIT